MSPFNIVYGEDKMRIYLRRGTNISTPVTKDGLTPLHVLVQSGWKPEEVKLVLSHGANVNARDARGRTPLHLIPETSDLTTVAWLLLDAGADPNARTLDGESVIGVASKLNRWAIVSLLIEHDADVNAAGGQSGLWDTPLHMACRTGNSEATLMLLDKGADVNARGYEDRTPLHASVELPNSLSLFSDYVVIIRHLVDRGCDIDSRDAKGQTPLHVACANGSSVGVLVLLTCGANIDIEDASDRTPVKVLHELDESAKNPVEISMLLLEHAEALRIIGLRKPSREEDEVNQLVCKYLRKQTLTKIQEGCRKEFEGMKTIRLDHWTTLDQFLTKSDSQIARHVKNPDVEKIVFKQFQEYPIFGSILRDRFRTGCLRGALLEIAFRAFESLTLRSWHFSCVEVIFDYLENSHLINLIDASKL